MPATRTYRPRAKQIWEVGEQVKVGFLTMTVVKKVPTPGDHAPDEYILISKKGERYSFVPHHGLSKLPAGLAA